MLLIVASLLVRALDRAMSTPPGFAYQQVVSIDPGLDAHGFSAGAAEAYLDALSARLRGVPGVESVSLASTPPLGDKKTTVQTEIDGRVVEAHVNRVDPSFLRTMGVPLLRGRNLAPGDLTAAVVSESLALRLWPDADPIGRVFDHQTVVGVVGNARMATPADSDAVEASTSHVRPISPRWRSSCARSGRRRRWRRRSRPWSAARTPRFPRVRLLKTAFQDQLRQCEIGALAVSAIGLSALVLACLGTVGLVAFTVAQRTREIGIRIALGANGRHVLWVVLRQLTGPVAAGLLLGAGGAAALFIVAAAVTAMVPASGALRVDPVQALRQD